MKMLKNLFKKQEGQALTEYGLIIGLVAVVCIALLIALGTDLQAVFQSIIDQL